MPAPRHPRHLPATLSLSPYHPHPPPNSLAYSTRSPRSTSPPYSTATYAPHHPLPPPLHTLPLYMHLPRSPAAHCDPILNSPLLPFRTASHPSSARTHPILSTSQTSFYTPSPPPFPCTLRAPFCRKVCTPPPKASSNPPVEIFWSKGRRTLILNILPRRHRVDNSVGSSVHSEEKA